MTRELEHESQRVPSKNGKRSGSHTPGRANTSGSMAGPITAQPSGILHRAAARDANDVTGDAEQRVERAASSAGSPLPDGLRERFESSVGTDLSGVRVHTGAESADAANAVGAKAYATGQDIHFAAGRYDTSSSEGQLLLAHEVAHTVQQAGHTPVRQNKLEVSSPSDGAEVEADSAATAMVEGRPAMLSSAQGIAHRAVIHRDKDEDTEDAESELDAEAKAWAEAARPNIQDVADTTAEAVDRVNGDAEAAITAIEQAQTSYSNYEDKYEDALARFKEGVEVAQKAEQELREAAGTVANTVLGVTFPLLAATKSAITKVLDTANDAAQVANVMGLIPKGPEKAGESSKEMGPSGKVDWKALLTTTTKAFKTYLAQNKTLAAIAKAATANERFVSDVIEGKYDGQDVFAMEKGMDADNMSANYTAICADLEAILGDEVSSAATAFAADASAALDGLTPQKIEQDIAIKWMSGLSNAQRDEIDTADSYLRSIGVIDSADNRLGYDTGGYTLDGDEAMVHMRAQVEQMAMNAVGNTGEWLGGSNGIGRVRDANGISWPATSTEPVCDTAGGPVLLLSYTFGPTQHIGDGWSRPGSDADIKQMMVSCCTFTFKPMGQMGGGVYNGPSVSAGK